MTDLNKDKTIQHTYSPMFVAQEDDIARGTHTTSSSPERLRHKRTPVPVSASSSQDATDENDNGREGDQDPAFLEQDACGMEWRHTT